MTQANETNEDFTPGQRLFILKISLTCVLFAVLSFVFNIS